jgi:hypothetical protein
VGERWRPSSSKRCICILSTTMEGWSGREFGGTSSIEDGWGSVTCTHEVQCIEIERRRARTGGRACLDHRGTLGATVATHRPCLCVNRPCFNRSGTPSAAAGKGSRTAMVHTGKNLSPTMQPSHPLHLPSHQRPARASCWVRSSPAARSESGGGRPEALMAESGGRQNQLCSATSLFFLKILICEGHARHRVTDPVWKSVVPLAVG